MDLIPAELKARPQWVTWKSQNGTKVPFDPYTGKHASSTKSHTWASFDIAARAAQSRKHDGVGYVFASDDPYVGIDLDDCLDDAGVIAPWAGEIVQAMGSYTEVSPSGHGLKIWVIGQIPGSVKTPQIEIYDQARYFTVTGRRYDDTPTAIRSVNGALDDLYASLKPPEETKEETYTSPVADDSYLRAWADRVIERAEARMRAAADRTRHNTRLAMGRLLGGLIGHGLMTEDRAERILYDAQPPQKNQTAERQAIRDGIANGKGDRLEAPEPPPQPIFDSAQFACCPEHKRRLEKGRVRGWYCPEIDQGTASGWCNFWWEGKDYAPPKAAPAAPRDLTPSPKMPIDVNDLLTMERKPTIWFAPSFLREGLGLLVGQPNVGKTPLAAQLAIAIATGTKWIEHVVTRQAKVLYLGMEYSAQELIPLFDISRCGKTIPREQLLIKTIEDEFPTTADEALAELEWYLQVVGVRVIIIDVLTAFLPPEKFKQNVYRGDYSELKPYHKLALKYNAVILGVWHASKRESDPRLMYNGSTGMWAAAASRITMYQDQEQRVRVASFARMADKVDWALTQEKRANGRRWIVADANPEPVCSPTELQIYRCLRSHADKSRPFSAQTVADMTGIEVRTIRTLLPRMYEKNLIQKSRSGDGYYIEIVVAHVADVAVVAHVADVAVVASQHEATFVAETLLMDTASESAKTPEQQEQRLDLAIGEQHPIWQGVPLAMQTNLRLFLRGNREVDQDRARELCEQYGIDYATARDIALKKGR